MLRRLRRAPAAKSARAERTRHVVRLAGGLECVVSVVATDAPLAGLDRSRWIVRDFGGLVVAVRVEWSADHVVA